MKGQGNVVFNAQGELIRVGGKTFGKCINDGKATKIFAKIKGDNRAIASITMHVGIVNWSNKIATHHGLSAYAEQAIRSWLVTLATHVSDARNISEAAKN